MTKFKWSMQDSGFVLLYSVLLQVNLDDNDVSDRSNKAKREIFKVLHQLKRARRTLDASSYRLTGCADSGICSCTTSALDF